MQKQNEIQALLSTLGSNPKGEFVEKQLKQFSGIISVIHVKPGSAISRGVASATILQGNKILTAAHILDGLIPYTDKARVLYFFSRPTYGMVLQRRNE
jgi:hypothetical protein